MLESMEGVIGKLMLKNGKYIYGFYDKKYGFYDKQEELEIYGNLVLSKISNFKYVNFLDNIHFSDSSYKTLFILNPVPDKNNIFYGFNKVENKEVFLYEEKKEKIDFKILIATNSRYIKQTEIKERLSQISNDKLHYVISESKEEKDFKNYSFTKRNFWEYCALWKVSEIKNPPEYWFLVHDTCLFGDNFYENLFNYNMSQKFDVVSINKNNQFNIGFYKHDFLLKTSSYISSLEGMTKEEGIKIELGANIRKKSNFTSCFEKETINPSNIVKIWNGFRNETYIPSLDIYKYYSYSTGKHKEIP